MSEEMRFDLAERRVSLGDRTVKLRPKSFELLSLLASRPGHLFAKDLLLDRIWEGRASSDDVLVGCIRELRLALADDARSPEWIETVSGTGYRLLRQPAFVQAHASKVPTMPETGNETVTPDAFLAVLNFSSLNPRLASLSQAMARDISVGLARTRWIKVASSASAEQVAGNAQPSEAASLLGVRYTVEGDVRRIKGGLAVQVTLTDVERGAILWADRIEQSAQNIQQLLEELCAGVIASVETAVERAEREKALLSPIRGVDAWIGFHRGMNHLQKQKPGTLDEAAQVLRAAARADPTCARVAAARSWLCWQQVFFGVAASREASLQQAREFALESTSMDPRDAFGHWALARVQWLEDDMDGAALNLRRAVSLNPSYAIGHYSLGYTQYLTGQEQEAMESCDKAISLSPLDPLAFAFHCIKAHVLCFSGEKLQAAHHARCVSDHPNVHAFAMVVATWVHELSGDSPTASRCLAQIRTRWPRYTRSDYFRALFHQSPWYPKDRRRAIEGALDRLGF